MTSSGEIASDFRFNQEWENVIELINNGSVADARSALAERDRRIEEAIRDASSPHSVASDSRPSNPLLGEFIYETDTGRTYVWDGSDWDYVYDSAGEALFLGHDGVISTADASGASYVHWPPTAFAEDTTPPWFGGSAIVQVNITGIFHISATGTDTRIRTDIEPGGGGSSVANGAERRADRLVVNDRFGLSWADTITGLSASTSYRFQVAAYRASGSGALRADASCDFDWTVTYLK